MEKPVIRNVFVQDFDGDENVMILGTTLTDKQVESALKHMNMAFTDCYEVPAKDVQYYLYDPLFANAEWDEKVKQNFVNVLELFQLNCERDPLDNVTID